MSFWDGARWVPDQPAGHARHSGRSHVAGAVAEAVLITAIVASLLLAMAPMSPPARFVAGTGDAAAGSKQAYTLAYAGVRVWQEPYAYADFTVSRAKADRTEVWVKAHCVDATGAQAIAGADPYGYVRWDGANPLVGRATLDSVKNGTSCEVWLTRSIKSTGATGGWPQLSLSLDW